MDNLEKYKKAFISALNIDKKKFNQNLKNNEIPEWDSIGHMTLIANLETAIAGETHEYTDMYPGMAKSARDEGFDEIADWFETLAKAERSHANRFQKALDAMSV